jgi:predicted metalloprotease with PDZ domain
MKTIPLTCWLIALIGVPCMARTADPRIDKIFAQWDTPSSMHLAHEADDKDLDLRYSLGFYVDDDRATIGDVIPRSPADLAGAAPGSHLVALNGYKWSKELLHDTLAVPVAATAGFMAGFTFVAAALGITYLFEFRSLKPGASTRAIR